MSRPLITSPCGRIIFHGKASVSLLAVSRARDAAVLAFKRPDGYWMPCPEESAADMAATGYEVERVKVLLP